MLINMIIFDESEWIQANSYNTSDYMCGGRLFDAQYPGVVVNLSDTAINFTPGMAVPLAMRYGVGAQMLIDPECPEPMLEFIRKMPRGIVDTDVVYAPPSGEI